MRVHSRGVGGTALRCMGRAGIMVQRARGVAARVLNGADAAGIRIRAHGVMRRALITAADPVRPVLPEDLDGLAGRDQPHGLQHGGLVGAEVLHAALRTQKESCSHYYLSLALGVPQILHVCLRGTHALSSL